MNGYNQSLAPFSIGGQDLANPNADFSQVGQMSANPDQAKMQMLAKMLSQYGQQGQGGQGEETQYVNGWAVPKSGMQGVGGMIGSLGSAYMGSQGK